MENIIYADKIIKKQENFWNHIVFHPTDAIEDEWGQKILDEASKDRAVQFVRIYAMFEDIFTQDENGEILCDYSLCDERIDYLLSRNFKPMIAYAGIPAFLARDSSEQSSMSNGKTRYKGKMWITSPPKDYKLWETLCRLFTEHILTRYGQDEVETWYLHCFNEPDIPGFFIAGDWDLHYEERVFEYCKLYEGFLSGITSVCTSLRLGGCAAATPPFLERFLQYVTKNKLRLDYVNFHIYGTDPMKAQSGEKPVSIDSHFQVNDTYYSIIRKYLSPKTEVVVDEWGACSHGFFKASQYPVTLFRETEKFSAYFFMLIERYLRQEASPGKLMICLSGQHEMTSEFEGFRNFFSLHFIKKPIYNAFILAGKFKENLLESTACEKNQTIIATKDKAGKLVCSLTYAAPDLCEMLKPKEQKLRIEGISAGKKQVTIWTIDPENTNPYAVSQRKGYPEKLNIAQIEELRAVGILKPKKLIVQAENSLDLTLKLLPNSVHLIEVEN